MDKQQRINGQLTRENQTVKFRERRPSIIRYKTGAVTNVMNRVARIGESVGRRTETNIARAPANRLASSAPSSSVNRPPSGIGFHARLV